LQASACGCLTIEERKEIKEAVNIKKYQGNFAKRLQDTKDLFLGG